MKVADFDDEDICCDSSVVSGQSSVREAIGEKETTLVNFSKVLVFFSICIMAILIGYVARSFLASREKTQYQTEVRTATGFTATAPFDHEMEFVCLSLDRRG